MKEELGIVLISQFLLTLPEEQRMAKLDEIHNKFSPYYSHKLPALKAYLKSQQK